MKLRITTSPIPMIVIVAALLVALNASAFAASGTWAFTGRLRNARDGQTATFLPNGNVVVAGGENNNGAIASTEVYSAVTSSWSKSGNLTTARSGAGAVLLSSGAVLIAGGCISNCLGATTATAELYNSTNGSWSSTGSMATARTYFSMVMLPGGKVLVVGGCTKLNSNGCGGVTAAAEVYDPSTGKWSSTSPMHAARGNLTATLLPNGKVLVAAGINAANNPLATAELYNPSTGKWSLTGSLNVARDEHTAVLLSTGNVLVVGGENSASVTTNKTELYNPSTGKWTFTGNLNTSRLEHTSTMLMNGNVLIAGGNNVTANTTTVLASAELYNPSTGHWMNTGSMNQARVGHSATLLMSGQVLAAAGSGANNELACAEIYKP
jgi:N-acetylneuraminic acid mutarotase